MTTSMKLVAGTSMTRLPVHLVSRGEADIAAMSFRQR